MFIRILFAVALATATATASQLSIIGRGLTSYGTVNVNVVNLQAVAGDQLSDSQSTPQISGEIYSNSSFEGHASFGHLGVKYQVEAACIPSSSVCQTAKGDIQVESFDRLFIVGAQDGFLALDIIFDGTASGTWDNDAAFVSYSITNGNYTPAAYAQLALGTAYSPLLLQNFYGSNIAHASLGSLNVFSGTAYIPFFNGEVALKQRVRAQWECSGGALCQFNFDFLNSARAGNARIFDASRAGTIAGATITSESGYDYTQPMADTSVPEPGSLIAVASGLLFLLRRQLTYNAKSNE